VDLSNGQERTLEEMPLAQSLALSPDDKTLYLTACEGDSNCKRTLIALDVVTGKQRTVLSLPNADSIGPELSLSPDGRTLALLTGSNSSWQISRVGVDGSGYVRIYEQKETSGWAHLKWTPDGAGITFTVTLPSRNLAFSSDGSRLALITEQPGFTELRAIDNLSSYLSNH
jgi:Tol biopolymer transport system component